MAASNGYNAPMELPRPTSSSGTATNASTKQSPTLESYHMTSRSPEEQRRASVVSNSQSAYTLPPMQGFTSSEQPHADAASHENGTLTQNAPTSPPAALATTTSNTSGPADARALSLTAVKPEPTTTPFPSSPMEERRPSDPQSSGETSKTITSLKNEHGLRTQSPLRDSSVPIPSTEMPASNPKKRPAPSKKKGTASSIKKAPASKKRKVEPKNEGKTSNLKANSSRGTPGAASSPAPSARSYSAAAASTPDEEMEDIDSERDGDSDLYCICKKPDNGTFMIGCDGTCDDWFHGKCVGIEEKDKNLIDRYICPNCEKLGIGKTTFKAMCRKGGCRQPARVGKSKGAKGSKYCSEACGVAFFAEATVRSEASKERGKSRSSRKKGSVNLDEDTESLAARGGVLAPGEIKALLHASKNAEDFKKLGDGVLSPPDTPNGKDGEDGSNSTIFTTLETAALQEIATLRERARTRYDLLKDRMRFVNMVKAAASQTAVEKELKPKEFCGYDSRLEWTEETFGVWRSSAQGKTAMELETLNTEGMNTNGNGDTEMADGNAVKSDGAVEDELNDYEVCDKKKCARHAEWTKVCVDHVREELSGVGDTMRGIERDTTLLKEKAALRSKSAGAGGEGSVEVHEDTGEDEMMVENEVEKEKHGDEMELERPVTATSMELPMRKVSVDKMGAYDDAKSKSGSEVPEAKKVSAEQDELDTAT